MTVHRNAVLDAQDRRPDSVSVAAILAAVVAGGTFLGLFYLSIVLFDPTGSEPFTVIVSVLAVVQVTTGVLLFVGAGRISRGAGRGMLFAGCALEFLLCATYGWYAVAEIAGDPQDDGVFPLYFGLPCGVAVVTAGITLLALLPSARTYASHG